MSRFIRARVFSNVVEYSTYSNFYDEPNVAYAGIVFARPSDTLEEIVSRHLGEDEAVYALVAGPLYLTLEHVLSQKFQGSKRSGRRRLVG